MTEDTPTPDALATRLLLLPDGSVLAENLTPSMAAVLEHMNVHANPETQTCLCSNREGKTIVNRGGVRKTGQTSDTGNIS